MQNRNRQRSRAAEAEQANALPRLHPGNTQAPKTNDTRAQERRNVDLVEALRQRERKV
jgi:hypothetical protein